MTRTHQLYLDQAIDSAGFKELYTPQKERLRQLQEHVLRVQADLDICRINTLSSEVVVSEALDLQKRWPDLDLEEKRRVVESLVESITVDNDTKEIEITLSWIPSSEGTTKSQQTVCALLGLRDRVIRVKIPKASVHRRVWRKVVAEPKTIGEHLRRMRVDMGLTNLQAAQSLGRVCKHGFVLETAVES